VSYSKITFKGAFIYYKDEGHGIPVVLLHGYLESLDIFDGFAERLTPFCRIIRPDLPGHGKSDLIEGRASMDDMAEAVHAILEHLALKKAVIIGHSMGGYVSQAFANNYPEAVVALGLLHSSPLADIPQKKENRLREIKLVKAGRKVLIAQFSIPQGFAPENDKRLKDEIDNAIAIAAATSAEGIEQALRGMAVRPDYKHVLQGAEFPVLFVLGVHDSYFAFNEMLKLTELAANKQVVVLQHSGHNGFIEEPQLSADAILQFIKTI
jgi:pimeloyl-ACP methyl ester carboxylesterase